MIALEQVSFSFGDSPLLENISFRVEAGECLVILGPNGTGKTTLLRLLAGVLPPRSGRVLLEGRPITGYSPRERAKRIGWMPQTPRAELDFTVLEYVQMGRHPYHGLFSSLTQQDETIVRGALEEMGISRLAEQPVTRCSGGELQRAAAARMLAQTAPLLLLDEPVSNLDIRNQVDTLSAIRRRTDRGAGAVCVLHDLNLAAHYATRILLLQEGRILADGAPETVLEPERLSAVYGLPLRRVKDGQLLFLPDYIHIG